MELLSPAGNREALIAAISCGADAVYLGYTAFGARSYAGNFDADQLKEALDYAHERGKKIYVTVNTLVKPDEIGELCNVLELLCSLGADAALVQDMGVVRIARERFPELTLHASTQMTVTNAQGAKLLHDLGFARVVPARECRLDELRLMADTGIEVEAFAHGALCVAVSGQCLFSSMVGGRSGNRGRCAQPCRMLYSLNDGTRGYLLSTKDLMTLGHLRELRDAGVCSLKIEGRMKRPEYVGVVTRAYRKALDALAANGDERLDAKTLEELLQIFHRGGFTEGYAMGKSHAALMNWERPNHGGVRVGEIVSIRGALAKMRVEKALHDGDGLQTRGIQEIEVTYSGKDVPAGEMAIIRIAQSGVQAGDSVYRLTDAAQMTDIRSQMAHEYTRIPLSATLRAMPDELPVLMLQDTQGHAVRVEGERPVERAQKLALNNDTALKQIAKTGGTPYEITRFVLQSENAFMTASALNALRRNALDAMRQARTAVVRQRLPGMRMDCSWVSEKPQLVVKSARLHDAPTLLNSGADAFLWQPNSLLIDDLTHELQQNPNVCTAFVLPVVTTTRELSALYAFVCEHSARFEAVVLQNIGQFAFDWPVPVWGGQGLNVMNGDCARFYGALGAKRVTASCEMSETELQALTADGIVYEIEAYGRTQLMLLSHCPQRTMAGETTRDAKCCRCEQEGGWPAVYTDRKGYRFKAQRLKCEEGCILRLYNSVPTDLARFAEKLRRLGCSIRLHFTDETIERQCELTRSYRHVIDEGSALHTPYDTTTGRFHHPVE